MISKTRLGFIGAALTLMSVSVCADTLNDWVQEVALTRQDALAIINQQTIEFVFVGQHRGCEQVAALQRGGPQINFEICGQEVRDKHSVAPLWPADDGSRTMLTMVVNHALNQGQFQATDPNGYLIFARRQSAIGACVTLSVNISYAGDLVDRDTRRICH
ncbi:hypothetical protein [Castellaniella ginsengisoli]|uniref:DUF2147 domain-containing protein n=1 Tax=Castellaniella ginsengisoli TaxID=546114 RepID=A0AB39FNE6_9BURK